MAGDDVGGASGLDAKHADGDPEVKEVKVANPAAAVVDPVVPPPTAAASAPPPAAVDAGLEDKEVKHPAPAPQAPAMAVAAAPPGEDAYLAFINRQEVKDIPALLQAFKVTEVKDALVRHMENRDAQVPNFDDLRGHLADEKLEGDGVRRYLVEAFGDPADLNLALKDNAKIRNGEENASAIAAQARGLERFKTYIRKPEIAATPLLAALETKEVKEELIKRWGIPRSQADFQPLLPDLTDLSNKLGKIPGDPNADPALVKTEIVNAYFGAGVNADAIAGNVPQATLTDIRNQARGPVRYQAFITQPQLNEMPVLKRVLESDDVKAALEMAWRNQNPPAAADINVLRDNLAAANPAAAGPVHNNFERAFGINLNVQLRAADIADGTEALTNLIAESRGLKQFNDFIEQRGDVQAMPGLREILRVREVKAALAKHWGHNEPPDNARLNALRAAIGIHPRLDGPGVITAFGNAFGNVPDLANALRNHVGEPALTNLYQEARGQELYKQFMERPNVFAAVPELRAFFETPAIRDPLVAHWGRNPATDPNIDIEPLLSALAASNNAAGVKAAFQNHLPLQGIAAIPDAAFTDPLIVRLRGRARYLEFRQQSYVGALPDALKEVLKNSDVANALIYRWGSGTPPHPMPTEAQLKKLVTTLANAPDAAAMRSAFTAANGFADGAALANALNNDATLSNANRVNALRGQARFQDFIARADVVAMPALLAVMKFAEVKNLLERHFATNNPPENLTNILTAVAGAGADRGSALQAIAGALPGSTADNEAQYRTAIDNAILSNLEHHAEYKGATINEGTLRGEIRFQKLLSDKDNATILTQTPDLDADIKALKPVFVAHLAEHKNTVPNDAVSKVRTALVNAPDLATARAAFTEFGPIDDLVEAVNLRIADQRHVDRLREETRNQLATEKSDDAKKQRKNEWTTFKNYRNALENLDPMDQVSKNQLAQAAKVMSELVSSDHELQKSARDLYVSLTRSDAPLNEEALKAVSDAKSANKITENRIDRLAATTTFGSDFKALSQYGKLAKIYKTLAERRTGSISERDRQEEDRILQASKKMLYTIDAAESILLARKEEITNSQKTIVGKTEILSTIETKLLQIEACREDLNSTIKEIQTQKNQSADRKINTFSDKSEVIDKSQIKDKVDAFLENKAHPNGQLITQGRIKQEGDFDTFNQNKFRINCTTITSSDGDRIKVASVQGMAGNEYKSDLYVDYNMVGTMSTRALVKLASVEVENFLAGQPNKNVKWVLNDMHPKLAQAMIMYCKIQKYFPLPSSNVPLPQEGFFSRYEHNFKEILKKNENDEILGAARGLSVSAEKRDKYEKEAETTHKHIPRRGSH